MTAGKVSVRGGGLGALCDGQRRLRSRIVGGRRIVIRQ
jgi:hypothetical protein